MLNLVYSADAARNNLVTKPRLPLWKIRVVLDDGSIQHELIQANEMVEALCKAAVMFKKAISIAVSMT